MIDWILVGAILVFVVLPLVPVVYALYGVLKSFAMIAKATTYNPHDKYKETENEEK